MYFAFHYQYDIWRINQVRNSWLTKPDRQTAGFFDASLWEKVKKEGDIAIKRMINAGLEGTSVTAFLLGAETANRRWVKYELEKSFERGNGLLAIHIHKLRNSGGMESTKGTNILDLYTTKVNGRDIHLSSIYHTYDWVGNNGYLNFANWVEEAARIARK